MTELLNRLGQLSPSFWVSITALSLSIASFAYIIRTARFSRRLSAYEKKTDTLQTLAEARFTVSQILLRLKTQKGEVRIAAAEWLNQQTTEAERLEKQLDTQFDELLSAPANALVMERKRQEAKVTLASVKKVADSMEHVERLIGKSGGSGAA